MNAKVTLGVMSGLVALMLVFIASRRKSAEIAERLQYSAQTVAELEQRLEDLQQTVGRQSRLINQLRAEPLGQPVGEPEPIESEDLWVTLEPFVEQHLEDREERKRDEQRQRREEAMAKSRERHNQQLAEQLGLNPFQAEQLAKLRDEFQAKRRELMMPEEGEPFDPKRLPEILGQLEKEERTRLAGFLTPEQVNQYQNRSSQSVQVMSLSSEGGGAEALSKALNFSIQIPPGAAGASAIRTLTVQGDTVGDDGTALIIQESDFITEGEGSGEIIFEEGEPPLPPFRPLPFPVPPPPE